MKVIVLAIILALGIGAAYASTPYHAPAHNYYQNNWMSSMDSPKQSSIA